MSRSDGRRNLSALLLIAAVFLAAIGATGYWLIKSYVIQTKIEVAMPSLPPPAPASSNTPAAAAGGPMIGGVVRNEKGEPVANVRIRLQWWHAGDVSKGERGRMYQSGQTNTNVGGLWSYSGVPRDQLVNLSLNLTNKDYITESVNAPPAAALLDRTQVVVLKSGFDVTGDVVDGQGKPISGARLNAAQSRWQDNAPTAHSTGSGHFAVHHVPGGPVDLLVTAKGYAPELADAVAQADANPLKITLSPGQTLRGRVVDNAGKPILGVNVTVNMWRYSQSLSWDAMTDAAGRFTMPDAPADSVSLSFNKQGYESPEKEFTAGPTEQVMTLKQMPVFSGQVTDADTHHPIANFRAISGAHWPGWSGPIYGFNSVTAFTNGSYTIKPGGFGGEVLAWYVRIEADGYLPAAADSGGEGGPLTRDFALKHGPDVQGHLVDTAGKPVAAAQMILLIPNGSVYFSDARPVHGEFAAETIKSDAEGNFRFHPQVAPFEIWALTDAGCAQQRFTNEYDGRPLEMKLLAWASVRMHIGPADSTDLPKIGCSIDQADDPARKYNYSHWSYEGVAAVKGEELIQRLPATYPGGLAELQLGYNGKNGYTYRDVTVALSPGQTVLEDLTAGVTVTGHAVPPAGHAAATGGGNILLEALPDTPPAQWPADTLSAARAMPAALFYSSGIPPDGTLTLPGTAPGRYEYSLTFMAKMAAAGILTVPAGAKTFPVPDITYAPFSVLKVGDAAPARLGRTLENQPIQLGDQARRYAVWMVWDNVSSAHPGDSPALESLAASFAGNPRVALIASNANRLSNNNVPPVRPPTLKGWTNGYLSTIDAPLFDSLSYYDQNGPVIFIIDPAGKIAAADVPADEAAGTLARLLAGG